MTLLKSQSQQSRQQLVATDAFRAADVVLNAIQRAQLDGKRLTYIDSTDRNIAPIIKGTQELANVLDPVPGYFMVLDQSGKLLYSSSLTRLLSVDDQAGFLRNSLQLDREGSAVIFS